MSVKKIRQSNEFVEAPYAVELTSHEIKVLEYLISECKEIDVNLIKTSFAKTYKISSTQLSNILNTSKSRIIADGDKLSASIMQKIITEKILDAEGNTKEYKRIQLIPYAEYKNGIFIFDLNYRILKHFININKNFTEYQLHHLLSMNSAYAIKLYKLLYQYKNIKRRVFGVNELKEQFGISNKYPLYGDFKRRIIDSSVEQINKMTDLDVTYNEIKYGRKVENIEFIFNLKLYLMSEQPISLNKKSELQINQTIKNINEKLSSNTKQLLINCYENKGNEYVEASINYAKKNAKTNFDKYLNDTLVNGWAEVEYKKLLAKSNKDKTEAKVVKEIEDRDLKIKEEENLNKSLIEHEWNKLGEGDKEQYNNYANHIISKHENQLKIFSDIKTNLYLCIYAITNKKSYNRKIESYLLNILSINLDLNSKLKTI